MFTLGILALSFCSDIDKAKWVQLNGKTLQVLKISLLNTEKQFVPIVLLALAASCFMGDSRQRNAKYVRHVRQWLSSLLYALVLLKLPPLLAPGSESASRNKLKWQQSLLAGNYACLIDVETSASTSKRDTNMCTIFKNRKEGIKYLHDLKYVIKYLLRTTKDFFASFISIISNNK